jgi:hypothetical protein
MRSLRLPPKALPLVFALVLVVAGPARAGDATKAEAEAYASEIAETHSALGEAIVLMGRMIQTSLRDPRQVDSPAYSDAITRVEQLVAAVGGVDALEARLESLKAEEIRDLHRAFVRCVAAMERTSDLMVVANYYYSEAVQLSWEESRESFIAFTDSLEALKAEYGIAA